MPQSFVRWLAPGALLAITACGDGGGTGPGGIGPAGGTVTATGGAAVLVIPANALASPVDITLRLATSPPLDPQGIAGAVFEIGPAGTQFSVPASLTVQYDASKRPDGTEETDLALGRLVNSTWTVVQGTTDGAVHHVVAPVGAAGVYGVRWPGVAACATAEHHQFDFWLGSWNFIVSGVNGGTNDITRAAGSCVIEEHFHDAGGPTGRSVSFYSERDQKWHQTYIDTQSTRLLLSGRLESGDMVLYTSATERFIWHLASVDQVRYYGERTPDGGTTWNVFFDSFYVRR